MSRSPKIDFFLKAQTVYSELREVFPGEASVNAEVTQRPVDNFLWILWQIYRRAI